MNPDLLKAIAAVAIPIAVVLGIKGLRWFAARLRAQGRAEAADVIEAFARAIETGNHPETKTALEVHAEDLGVSDHPVVQRVTGQ